MREIGLEQSGEGGDEPTVLMSSLERSAPGQRVEARREGLVVALAPGLFEVVTDDGASYLCTLRGRLRKSRPAPRTATTSVNARAPKGSRSATALAVPPNEAPPPLRIAPGDRVMITPLSGAEGVIEAVAPRRTTLARTRSEVGTEQILLANADVAALIFAMREPAPRFGLLDRYLALCEHANVAAVICMNKVDLGVTPELERALALYAGLGYPVIWTSATTGAGLDELRAHISGKISLLTGPSGVGKSSLTNALIPGASQRVGEISQATHKGRHTTTGVRLLPLPESGWLADSAGIRELALWNVPADELSECFVELRRLAGTCLYEDCQHGANEEGCAFREALARGAITMERYASFERLLDEARAEEAQRRP
jgi:ribosome biogenesis GTPase / thiamine phosphate phosphatase